MTKNLSKTLSQLDLSNVQHLLMLGLGAYIVYMLSRGLTRLDDGINTATKPVGQAWSDISAWIGGYRPVELTDLVLYSHYFDPDWRLTNEAYRVLWNVPEYRQRLGQIFTADGVLKAEYRELVRISR